MQLTLTKELLLLFYLAGRGYFTIFIVLFFNYDIHYTIYSISLFDLNIYKFLARFIFLQPYFLRLPFSPLIYPILHCVYSLIMDQSGK